jgi:hypothetical protein
MNQPESVAPQSNIPLHQLKGQLINKGYSYHEIKEANAVITIFKAAATETIHQLPLPPINEN